MENYTLTFNYMKAKVAVKLRGKELAEYAGLVMFAILVFYVAVNPHR